MSVTSRGPAPAGASRRVSATVRVLTSGVVPLGALAGGLLGEAIGLRATVLVGASGVLLAFLWVLLSPVRSLRSLPAEAPSETDSPPPGDVEDRAGNAG